MYNFAAIDPAGEIAGMSHGGRGDQVVWDKYSGDRERLARTAEAIRANLRTLTSAQATVDDEEIVDAPEGALLTRVHRTRGRSATLVRTKTDRALAEQGKLESEACGFDFAATYGQRRTGFIECHHTQALSSLRPGDRTRLDALALVCSNCDRMIHRASPWLTVAELRGLITRPDAHGTPALSAPHGVCSAPGGLADAYDWNFCWKSWDALRRCALNGTWCSYGLGNTRNHRSNGRWSDGVPITPLKIQDAAPIRP